MSSRIQKLDFLRGMAIVLVLIRHSTIWEPLVNMGWIGVDLFFVLSGFLVTGLLFSEYQQHGSLDIKRFLVRRGFKIYPLYYICIAAYAWMAIYDDELVGLHFLGDLLFIQNYINGWGGVYSAGWSLAVEAHFYLGLAGVLAMITKRNAFATAIKNTSRQADKYVAILIAVMVFCLLSRIASNYYYPGELSRNFTLTNFRIDSLLAGVLIAYYYHFKFEFLNSFYQKHYKVLLLFAVALLSWTPFVHAVASPFSKSIGFTFVYLAFGIVLLHFILRDPLARLQSNSIARKVIGSMSYLGVCSYSVYLIHLLCKRATIGAEVWWPALKNPYAHFFIYSTLSIIAGILMTKYVERFILLLRNRIFPSKSKTLTLKKVEASQSS